MLSKLRLGTCTSPCSTGTGLARQISSSDLKLARVTARTRSVQWKEREEKKIKRYGHATHVPVMMKECLEHLLPALNSKGTVAVDCTFGGGGHTSALLDRTSAHVYSIDRDPVAQHVADGLPALLAEAFEDHHEEELRERFHFVRGRFGNMKKLLSPQGIRPGDVDAILMDLGPSTGQFLEGDRGFSFMRDGPLDMRMDVADRENIPKGVPRRTAADVVNNCSPRELAYYFRTFAGERFANLYAKHIVLAREKEKFTTTQQLAAVIYSVTPDAVKMRTRDSLGRPMNLATRVFAALRVVVNDEIGELRNGLYSAAEMLRPGGHLAVISFHSLEAIVTKNFFRGKALQDPPLFESNYQVREATKRIRKARSRTARFSPPENELLFESFKRMKPSPFELKKNARARSAILFVGKRSDAPLTSQHRRL